MKTNGHSVDLGDGMLSFQGVKFICLCLTPDRTKFLTVIDAQFNPLQYLLINIHLCYVLLICFLGHLLLPLLDMIPASGFGHVIPRPGRDYPRQMSVGSLIHCQIYTHY